MAKVLEVRSCPECGKDAVLFKVNGHRWICPDQGCEYTECAVCHEINLSCFRYTECKACGTLTCDECGSLVKDGSGYTDDNNDRREYYITPPTCPKCGEF